ncbi:MAG: transporter substrate-binding domain-containing protein, partial [Magnetococcales bacterium]|nr:transporter substrate-binding domain-containing protein [Magnetococcales bacterium]
VAQVMGLQVRFRVGPWNEVRTALERGEIDALPLVSYSVAREKVFDFTTPHTVSYGAAFIRKGDDGIESEEGLRSRNIIVMQSDGTHDYLTKYKVSESLILVKTVPEALRRLSAGEGDLALVPRLVGLLTANELGLTNIEISGPQIAAYGRGYGFAVHEGNTELLAHLNQGLSIVKATGKYDELYDKWFGVVDPRGVSLEVIYKYATIIGGGFLVILAVALLWSWSLKREVRQRKAAEAQMSEAKEAAEAAKEIAEAANQAKSDFLANMSHELRTPLHVILGFAQLMVRDRNLSVEHQENLGIIGRSGEHLLELINDVLEMSKIEAGKIVLNQEKIDLLRTLQDVAEMMRVRAEDKELQFTVDFAHNLPTHVQTDSGKLRQALINLIGNAIKFTEQGTVSLRVRIKETETGMTTKDHPDLLCEVEDTGVGISEHNLKEVFSPFIQVVNSSGSMKGTGLGLSITRHYIQLMGGDLEVSSHLGQGSLFSFHIPVTYVAASDFTEQKRQRRVVGLEPGQPVPRILIVEDVQESRLLLRKLLVEVGFDVREAVNGQEALEQFKEWRPNLIWMDMRMPVMNGYEATRRIRNHPHGRETSIVALTANVFEEDRKEIIAAGCDDCVGKPFQEYELFDCMANYLKLRFRYEDETPMDEADSKEKVMLDRDGLLASLSSISPELQDALRHAVVELDTDVIASVVSRIGEQSPDLANVLKQMVDDYRLEELSIMTTKL